eukprot:CFRG3962T1
MNKGKSYDLVTPMNQHPYGIYILWVGNRLFVERVLPDSIANLAGIRLGDQIIKINDTDISEEKLSSSRATTLIGQNASVYLVIHKTHLYIPRRDFAMRNWGFPLCDNIIINTQHTRQSAADKENLIMDHTIISVNGHEMICLEDEEQKLYLKSAGTIVCLKLLEVAVYKELLRVRGSAFKQHSALVLSDRTIEGGGIGQGNLATTGQGPRVLDEGNRCS